MKHLCFSTILAAVLFNYANCQSGDKYLFTATPIENFPVDDEYENLDYGSGVEPTFAAPEEISKVARTPLTTPPCLYPANLTSMNENGKNIQRHSDLSRKAVLTIDDLYSNKVQLSGLLAVDKYVSSRNATTLKLKQYLGGCKQHLAGELLYLIFSAEETRFCQSINCTGPVVLNQECRARILVRNDAPWDPYSVECQSPDFYSLPWRGITTY